jgi:hypothetical protein
MNSSWYKNKKLPNNNTSGHVGVSYNISSNRWTASIRFRGEYFHLGTFGEIKEAIQARKRAEDEFDALLNNEIIGKKFGRLTILSRTTKKDVNGAYLYQCRCECGKTALVTYANLTSKKVASCGCARGGSLPRAMRQNRSKLRPQ